MTASNSAASPTLSPTSTQETPDRAPAAGTTIGVTGLRPRWSVSAWGAVSPWDANDMASLEWFVAADDRWHVPAQEPTVRQRRLDGTPVVETRVRIPDGDVIQRVWAVPERGGMVVIEFENESPLPVAVAVAGRSVITERATSDVPIQGIELPDDAIVLPLGHHATVRILLPAVDGVSEFVAVPPPLSVVRGWTRVTEQASRFVVPDEALMEAATAARCDLLLEGPVDPADATGFLLDVAELVRCGDDAEAWLLDVVEPAERVARSVREATADSDVEDRREALGALRSAAYVAGQAGDNRAAGDIERMISDLASGSPARRSWFRRGEQRHDDSPVAAPVTASSSFAEVRRSTSVGRFIRSVEQRIVAPAGSGSDAASLLPGGVPTGWLGSNFEVHGMPSGPHATVSFAVRWHGERPAVLWEQHGETVTLTSPAIDESWSTTEPSGETLLAAPKVAASVRSSLLVTAAVDDQSTVPSAEKASSTPLSGGILSVDPDGGSFA